MLARGEREINQLLLEFVCCRFAFGFSGPPLFFQSTDNACKHEPFSAAAAWEPVRSQDEMEDMEGTGGRLHAERHLELDKDMNH